MPEAVDVGGLGFVWQLQDNPSVNTHAIGLPTEPPPARTTAPLSHLWLRFAKTLNRVVQVLFALTERTGLVYELACAHGFQQGECLRIFLVRHGDADSEVPEALGDRGRALTAKARQTLIAHFGSISDRMTGAELIFTSPLVRAVQTAQILSLVSRHEGLLHAHRGLLPEVPVGALDSVLKDHVDQDLILVGHQPSMGALAAHLLGLQSFPKQVSPGTVIAMERNSQDNSGPAKLLFYASPGHPLLEEI